MTFTDVQQWVARHPLTPAHVDCATAVMLKILDGKCKMNSTEKTVMGWLYQVVKHEQGCLLGDDIHQLIAGVRGKIDEASRLFVYEKRVLAETMISRPVMKLFKKMIRDEGLFECHQNISA